MRNIYKAIEEHKAKVLEEYAEDQLLGVFVYGSQNYGMATENSDVDTKAILVPTFEDLVLREPISRELHLDNEEHCEVKDIREMIKMFTKQNINFIEILFTEYFWLNPKYEKKWKKYFVNNREKIAYMNPYQTIKSISGQAIHTLKQNPRDGKKFANGVRLFCFLNGYIDNEPYDKLLKVPDNIKNILMAYKLNKSAVPEKGAEILIECIKSNENYLKSLSSDPKEEVLNIMNNGLIDIIGDR